MPIMKMVFGEPLWPDLNYKNVIHITTPMSVGGLAGGMGSGKPSVAIRFDLPDGNSIIAETSLELFLAAADALKTKFGDPRTTPPEHDPRCDCPVCRPDRCA